MLQRKEWRKNVLKNVQVFFLIETERSERRGGGQWVEKQLADFFILYLNYLTDISSCLFRKIIKKHFVVEADI